MIFKLVPVDPSMPHWRMSTYSGVVLIRAESDERARDIAALAFSIAACVVPGHENAYLPWRHPELVVCHVVADTKYSDVGDEEILVPEVPAYEYNRDAA